MTTEAIKRMLRYSTESGEFWWTSDAPTKVRGKRVEYKDKHGYICLKLDGRMYKAHRIAWLFQYGYWPTQHIDHINGNKADNRICNLRDVSPNINAQNRRRALSTNSVGFLGVSRNGSGWRAEIRVAGKKINLGTYPLPDQAHAIYVAAKRKHHEGCTL